MSTSTVVRDRKITLLGESKIVDAAEGIVDAITAVTANVDHGGDLIEPGAFVLDRGMPKVVWSHDWSTIIGKTLEAKELLPGDPALPQDLLVNGYGGFFNRMQFNPELPAAQDALSVIDFDPTMQWSIGYEALDWSFVEEEDKPGLWRRLRKLFVFENSPVAWGMNPLTRTMSIKALRHLAAGALPQMPEATQRKLVVLFDDMAAALEVGDGKAEVKGAIASHSTATSTDAWDGAANEARLSNDAGAATYRKCYAWVDPEADADTKSAYKFPHHFVSEAGTPGAASTRACSAVIASLNGGRGGTAIPDADRQGVYNHVAKHLTDADLEVPELASLEDIDKSDDKIWPPPEGSYEAIRERISEAVRERFNYDPAQRTWVWVEATFADRAVISIDNGESVSYYSIAYTDDGEAVTLGEAVEVELVTTIAPKTLRIDVSEKTEPTDDYVADALTAIETEVNWLAGSVDTKVGRVLAQRNVDRLSRARDAIGEVLAEIESDEAGEDDGKQLVQLGDDLLWSYQKLRGRTTVTLG